MTAMFQAEHEQFIEPEYPAFPVVFQRELETEFESPLLKSSPHPKRAAAPEQYADSLFKLTQRVYETSYPSLFSDSLKNDRNSIQAFFRSYRSIDEFFIQEMKKDIKKLSLMNVGNNKIYVGEIKNNKCNGKCIIIFKNGNLYEGHIVNNKRCGKGAFVQSTSGWYIGQFKDDQKNGEGLQVNYKKNAYKGQFVNGLRHDKGMYVDDEGNFYDGLWKLGIMHGKGTLKTKKSTFTGSFVNWLKHGSGEERFSNGDVYRGEYQNGRFDGIGGYSWKLQGSFYEGGFRNGLRHGKGKWQRGQTKYNGGYNEGLKEGYGELYFPSGNFYKGNFVLDKKQGYGEMFWTDGSFFKGEWKGGNQHGKGQIYIAGGDIVSGIFQSSILVQAMPSIYDKQIQIANLSFNERLGGGRKNKPDDDPPINRDRTCSDPKGFSGRRKLTKIDQSVRKNHRKIPSQNTNHGHIHGKIFFKTPEKSEHSDGGCGTCTRRLQNFRLKQQNRKIQNHSIRHNSITDDL